MHNRLKIFLLSAGAATLLGHFILVFFYALPFHHNNRLSRLSGLYVYPFFHQNWSLFAPVPESDYSLIVSYENNGLQRRDLFREIVLAHRRNRLAGYGPAVLAFSNSIHYFEKNTSMSAAMNGPVKDDLNFSILEHEVKNYLRATEHVNAENLKMFLLVKNVRSGARRIYFN